jgi:hypothetical protein
VPAELPSPAPFVRLEGPALEAVRAAVRLAYSRTDDLSAPELDSVLVALVAVGSAEEAEKANAALYHHRECEAAQLKLNIVLSPLMPPRRGRRRN